MAKKKTIGIFISQISDRYHAQIWPTILQEAGKHNMNVLLFSGRSLNDPLGFTSQENIIYSLAGKENLDGLILAAGSLGNYVSDQEFSDFIGRYKGIPIVNISRKIQEISNISIDNFSGMFALVNHMIEVHNRKRIAFIRGPVNNPEAEIRYNAYQSALKMHGIPLDEDIIVVGSFAGPTGAEAVKELLDVRKVQFDCLIAANDDMLLWAMKILLERKIKIPEDIALGGFDNLEESQYTEPPLTTVEQPLILLSRKAAEVLINMVETGNFTNADFQVPASLLIRKSCGCFTGDFYKLSQIDQENLSDKEIFERLQYVKNDMISQLLANLSYPSYQKEKLILQINKIVDAYIQDVMYPNQDISMDSVFQEIIDSENSKENLEFWNIMLSHFQNFIFKYVYQNQQIFIRSNDIFHKAQSTISLRMKMAFNLESVKFWNALWDVKRITMSLSGTFEIDKIKEILSREFPHFSIFACNICLYENAGSKLADLITTPSERSRMIFGYNQFQDISNVDLNSYFSTKELAPYDILENTTPMSWGVFPLYFENIHFGFISFELNSGTAFSIQDSLKEHINAALKGAFLIQELKNTQSQLIEAAQIAKEANFRKSKVLVNMSHELRTPLNSINGIAGLLQLGGYEKTEEVLLAMKEMIGDISVYPEDEADLQTLKNELLLYKNILENCGNTRSFYFEIVKYKLIKKDSVRFQKIIEMLDKVITYLEIEYDETLKAYKHIKEAGIYLLGLIDTVLNLSKVESGKMDVFRTKVVIRSLIDTAVIDSKNYAHSLKKDELIEIKFLVHDDVPEAIYMDKQKVKEILLNLMSNGIKYSSKGIVQLEVLLESSFIKFIITDEGFGISEGEKHKIFTEFGRTNESKKIEGTGLGLVLSKKLVEMQDGQIGFESESGKGSTFWFTVPIIHKL